MSDVKDPRKVIPLFQQDREATIRQSLSEIYNAIYLLNLATDFEGVGIQHSEIGETGDELVRDLISLMREIHGYAEKASLAFVEVIMKHRLDYSAGSK
jgi:hypothetical protein